MKLDEPSVPSEAGVLPMTPALGALRSAFLGWQARARQFAVRRDGARPGPAMIPSVWNHDGERISAGVVTVLVERDPLRSTGILRQIYRSSHDPAERRSTVLEMMAGAFFQEPAGCSDALTALFLPGSTLAAQLLRESDCRLIFDDGTTHFSLYCRIVPLARDHPFYQATWYHNAMFNANLPAAARVLAFPPDWTRSGTGPHQPNNSCPAAIASTPPARAR